MYKSKYRIKEIIFGIEMYLKWYCRNIIKNTQIKSLIDEKCL